MIAKIKYIILLTISIKFSIAQNFINPDLNGTLNGISSLPDNWEKVSSSDLNCLAMNEDYATPDLTNEFGPTPLSGVMGFPFSGSTFVSGLKSNLFHEGIMQTVSGFIPGNYYIVNFQQAIIRQFEANDTSGMWGVYVDNNLAGIVEPTSSEIGTLDLNLKWESRQIDFIATNSVHTIKFLPFDDDSNDLPGIGAVRLGIDYIYITCAPSVELGQDLVLCEGDNITLDAFWPNSQYLWNNGTTEPTLEVQESGVYWVRVSNFCSIVSDTISIDFTTIPQFTLGNDTSFCLEIEFELNVSSIHSSFLWNNNSTDSSIVVNEEGLYWVEVSNVCGQTNDTISINSFYCPCTIELPNCFTPNEDNFSDYFNSVNNCNFQEYSFVIFNRWGQKVFETNDPNKSWNGKFRNRNQPSENYIFMIRFKEEQGEERIIKGSV